MSKSIDLNKVQMPNLSDIEDDLKRWEDQIANWAKRIPWSQPTQRKDAMITAKFLRKLVAEAWIHTLAAKTRGSDPMDHSAFRARRIHRQLNQYGPVLAERMEARLPQSVPSIAA